MSKRRLTDQQRRRINTLQQQRITKRHQAIHFKEGRLGLEQSGLIIANLGQQLELEADQGKVYRCFIRQNLGNIVPGDTVAWCEQLDENDQTGVITAVHRRKNILQRPDKYKQIKTVAANIDQMLIVLAVNPQPVEYYLDQYLVIAEIENINPVLVLNKTDLSSSSAMLALLNRYEKIGYPVICTSAVKQEGLRDLKSFMQDKNNIMVGQSGVGKSSLINALFDKVLAKTNDVSDATSRGKHTTTTARLYHLPFSGNLIDSPGIREFGLWHLEPEQILNGFREFHPYIGHCEFRNCTHRDEKGCAILQATKEGKIHPQRLTHFYRMLDQS